MIEEGKSVEAKEGSPAGAAGAELFYRLDSSRASFRELWWDSRKPLTVGLVWITKLMRVKLPGSMNDPNVRELRPFVRDAAAMPAPSLEKLSVPMRELEQMGFKDAAYLFIDDLLHGTRISMAVLRHGDGRSIARVVWREEHVQRPPKENLFIQFISALKDGRFVWSSSAKAGMEVPSNIVVNWQRGMATEALWASHQQQLQAQTKASPAVVVADQAGMLELLEGHHAAVRDFHLKRGLFGAMSEEDRQHSAMLTDRSASPTSAKHAGVLVELARIQNKKSSWTGAFVILLVSLGLFVAAGRSDAAMGPKPMELLTILIPILFFHELGHYLAMKVFGYRNLRMFFIPFFGAAVSGRNYTAPGWKKVIVALMGPVPGIILGGLIGIWGAVTHRHWMEQVGLFALLINGFNLLPVLPLDGGHVMHTLLFSRHFVADAIFKLIAAALLILAGWFVPGSKLFLFIGMFMLIGALPGFKLAQVVSRLRKEMVPVNYGPSTGLGAGRSGDQLVPEDVATRIIERIHEAFPKALSNRVAAQYTLQAYESLNARPPGWLGTTALGGVHLASLFLAIVLAGVVVFMQKTNVGRFARLAASAPRHSVSAETIQSAIGPDLKDVVIEPSVTVIGTFNKDDPAREAFESARASVRNGRAQLLGQTVMILLPASEDAARKHWFEQLESRGASVYVETESPQGIFAIQCLAPTEQAAQRIENELENLHGEHLIAPWDPIHPRTAEQRERHRIARETYGRLQTARGDYGAGEFKSLSEQATRARRQGDNEEFKKLMKRQGELMEQMRQREIEKIRAEGEDKVDVALVDKYIALQKEAPKYEEGDEPDEKASEKYESHYRRVQREIGPHLGQVAMKGDKPALGADRFSASTGFVRRVGLLISARFVRFSSSIDGAPAMTRWLIDQGCRQVKYEFKGMGEVEAGDFAFE